MKDGMALTVNSRYVITDTKKDLKRFVTIIVDCHENH